MVLDSGLWGGVVDGRKLGRAMDWQEALKVQQEWLRKGYKAKAEKWNQKEDSRPVSQKK